MTIALIPLIAGLSVIQSIFGAGLLVFGTPILVLMGYPFSDLLWILLPASLTISTLQLITDRRLDRIFIKKFVIWSIPGLALGLLLIFSFGIRPKLELLVAAALILTVACRFSKTSYTLHRISTRQSPAILLVIGLVHGLSNMGGGLLTAYAVSLYHNKCDVRHVISAGYMVFAVIQMVWLFCSGHRPNNPDLLISSAVAAAVYLTIGKVAFGAINNQRFAVLFSFCMMATAMALIWKHLAT